MSSSATGSAGAGQTTGAAGSVYTGYGGAAPTGQAAQTGTSGSGASMTVEIGRSYGLVVVLASMLGGFALLL